MLIIPISLWQHDFIDAAAVHKKHALQMHLVMPPIELVFLQFLEAMLTNVRSSVSSFFVLQPTVYLQ